MLINTAKGIETSSLMRLSQVIKQELPQELWGRIGVFSGPSHAEEVALDLPTTIVAAAESQELAERIQDLFMGPRVRVYTNPDVIGVELGGALKNVIALSTGISDGMGYGDNTRAALMIRGLTEIKRLGVAMGAQPMTFSGLSGVGDLIVTCNSMHSRNRRAGIMLGQGHSLDQVLSAIGMVVEGVETTKAAYHLAAKLQVEMPITNQIYQVLFGGLGPREAVNNLMLRQRKHEIEEVVLTDW
jgi:glycerol-3-phosphate dehydrogenase (NAD(P)+)